MNLSTTHAACASTEGFVSAVRVEQYDQATPCSLWNVRQLLNHLLGTLALGGALLLDTDPAVPMPPGGLPDIDLVGDDLVKQYRSATEALLRAAGGDTLARAHETPLGPMPGAALLGFTTLDIAVHGWDLARATGQDATLSPVLADDVLAFAHQNIPDEIRAPQIGPALPTAPGASPTDSLVAFLGRMP